MIRRTSRILLTLAAAALALTWGSSPASAEQKAPTAAPKYKGKVTPKERKEAAKRARALGLKPGVAGRRATRAPATPLPLPEGPGGIPHYFGPYGNWAYSPLPAGSIGTITIDAGGAGYVAPLVTVLDAYGTGTGASPATAIVDPLTGAITGITGGTGGTGYTAPFVFIEDDLGLCGGAAPQPECGTGAGASANIDVATVTGGLHKFVDKVAGLGPANANALVTPGRLGGATPGGQYIPVAVADTSIAGADYYVIGLVEYNERMHTDMGPSRQRGYVQLASTTVPGTIALTQVDGITPINMPGGGQAMAVDYPHFLGPAIVATGNKPVRIKFYNLLPTGTAGDLFIPVDTTVPGAGVGPNGAENFTQNRSDIHLHGNNTVWISDGTPHQWITPAGEATSYPKGVAVRNVPDMGTDCDAPGSGCQTMYYTNAMGARLMFYHDHALGITRLNVYAGVAAGYVITDGVDADMMNGTNVTGVNPGLLPVLPGIGIPLVIQDKTFVDANTIFAQDPTWNWGTGPRDASGNITAAVTGDVWTPHVYLSAQNPWDLTGTNAFGRWHYGPWFFPTTPTCVDGLPVGCIEVGPVPNEYYDPINSPTEPPFRPGTPNPSIAGEAFLDVMAVNGTVYPYVELEPKAYRFRILNASNDRMVNLQLYVAADKTFPTTANTNYVLTPAQLCDGLSPALVANCTEVKMVPVSVAPANQQADWPSGIPDSTTKGPDWWQIGTEGGFLPKPVVIPSQPIGWNLNPTTFNYGNVNQHSLLLGSAERADVVVDFSLYAGKTLILYNDAPAAFPAGVPSYDYYTGVASQIDTGGAPSTLPGYGPNTRTVMQIRVNQPLTTPTTDVTIANLNAVFAKNNSAVPPKRGVFEVSQDTIVMPQAAYNSAYDAVAANPVSHGFPTSAVSQYVSVFDTTKTLQPIDPAGVLQPPVTFPLEPKAMHDEMGGVYDTLYGRMSGMLGLTDPTPVSTAAPFIPLGYASPPTDINLGSTFGTLIGSLGDGTQIWKVVHNGVDTHTIHVHLFNAQLINRVSMDGIMLPPDGNELGWKDTFRINPLEQTIFAMRPIIPTPAQLPFQVPNSVRLIDPTLPDNAVLPPPPPAGWMGPDGNAITEIRNHTVNFGWEYVWHCHILAHEEMDMMHSLAFAVPPNAPSNLSAVVSGNGANKRVTLNWTDNSINETGFTIQRATNDTFTAGLTTFNVAANVTTLINTIGNTNSPFYYRVAAANLVGDTAFYPGSAGFPTKNAASAFSAAVGVQIAPAAPTNVNATGVVLNATRARFTVTWTDNANNETGYRVQWARNATFTSGVGTGTTAANATSFQTPTGGAALLRGVNYYFRVQSFNLSGNSAYVNFGAPTPVIVP